MSSSCSTESGGSTPPRFEILEFEHNPGNARLGFATILSPKLGLVFHRVPIFRQAGKSWTDFPTKPKLSGKGQATPKKTGGYVHEPVLEFVCEQRKARFDQLVFEAYDRYQERAS